MYKKRMIIYLFLVALSTFSFNLRTVNAYMSKTSAPAVNKFTVATFYTDTFLYNLNNNGTITRLGEKTMYKTSGSTINIDSPDIDVSSYILQSITINESGSYNIGDTYTQPPNDLSIVYTYRPKQTYTVSHNNSDYTFTGNNTALEGSTYTATVSPKNNYQIDSVTVTMGGNNVSNAYNSSNNTITVNNVSGNIDITVNTSGGCLAEGTKVMLWNGQYKNIENVKYNDLLKVWNHDKGTYGYTYAAYIEKQGKASKYTKVTFSDGSVLNIIFDHRLFSKRLNKYVNINSGELKVGDEVVKLENGIEYVKIESIDTIEEHINYYNIITTRYFNIIAEGLLTTYEITDDISSNYKGFKNNMIWNNQTPEEEKISYEEFINTYGYVDRYLYKSLKLEDITYAINQGFINQEELETIINDFMMNVEYRLTPPKDSDGNFLWMVTTSDDNNPSDKEHQMIEGSEYIVPTPNNNSNFKYWYNYSDNKYYQPGDIIIVDSSMYLEAIYE